MEIGDKTRLAFNMDELTYGQQGQAKPLTFKDLINCHLLYQHVALRSLLDEQSILSKEGSIFLENQLSEQAELSKQGRIFQECS